MKKEKRVPQLERIEKSFKFPGKVFVVEADGTIKSRNAYTILSFEKHFCYYKGFIWSFNYNSDPKNLEVVDVEFEGTIAQFEEKYGKPSQFSGKGKKEVEPKPEQKPKVVEFKKGKDVRHEQFNKIIACVENDIPVYLHGPAGSGKNFTLKQIADDLGLDFYFTNSVQQEYKITGFIDAGGQFHETEFFKAFKNGGLFFLDELDASIPEVLVLLNAAIANRYFEFPNGKIEAHENFRVVAAGNTVGDGASEQYTGRLQIDQSTLDRFVFIEFGYSEQIELSLAKGNKELVDFVRGIRKQAEEKGVRATFSYRCLISIKKLEGVLELDEIMVIAVFKGMDTDTLNTFLVEDYGNKYYKAMQAVQMKGSR